ncbi:MAG: hypothetical protein ACQXXJ_06585, partial [Candidatus Bathyarchaeia archaeon]
WQVIVGSPNKPFATFEVSPLNVNVSFLGQAFTVPLMVAINIAVSLSLLAGGIIMLIYSINPTKPYAKKLLGFAYRKPLYALLIFVIGLISTLLLTKVVTGLDVPLVGSANAKANDSMIQSLLGGVSITNVLFTATLQWPFYLAILSAALCITARIYDKKLRPPQQQ